MPEPITKDKKIVGYIVAIIVNVILLYVFNNLLNWHVGYLTSGWAAALWILNLSIVLTIVFNFIYIFFDPQWFKSSSQILLNIISIIFLYKVYITFPFTLPNSGTEMILKIAIVLGMVGSGIGILFEFFKIITKKE